MQGKLYQERMVMRMNDLSPVQVEVKDVEAQRIAGIRYTGTYCECGAKFGRLYKVFGRDTAGAPFNLYYDAEYKETDADIESCLPIKKDRDVDGVCVRTLPGGKCVSLIHYGPYEELRRSYESIQAYIAEHGLRVLSPSREIYLKGPGMFFAGNPKKYITEIQIMLDT
jgi:effector-binding domain-containing protein